MPKTTIEIENPINVTIRKCGKSIEADFAAFPERVRQFVISFGLRQLLNDCHSSEKDPDLAFSLVEKKLEALRTGTVKQGRTTDPYTAWLRDKLVNVLVAKRGGTKKEAKADLLAIGPDTNSWIEALYKESADQVNEQLRIAWTNEQKQAQGLASALGDINVGDANAE